MWGRQTNKKPSAEACADACRRHEPPGDRGGPYGKLPCNAFTFCPVQFEQCFEADAHTHHGGDCWLKFTEVPEAPQVRRLSSPSLSRKLKGQTSAGSERVDNPMCLSVRNSLVPPDSPSVLTWVHGSLAGQPARAHGYGR